MHIDVIIPAFNVAPYVGDAIRSVMAQDHHDWTLTVVDDGSSDATARIATATRDSRLRVIRQDNAGVSAARNRGLDAASGDAILFLDADDWLAPDALTRLGRGLNAAPDAIAAVGGFVRIDGAGRYHPAAPPPDGDLLHTMLIGNRFINGGHVLLRRTAVRAAGRFHEHLAFGEDWEYWVRLAITGPFAAAPGTGPVLFTRIRRGGACHDRAIDPRAYDPCIESIYAAPALADRLGPFPMQRLRRRTETEVAWTIGRAWLNRGAITNAWPWLWKSATRNPRPRRIAALAAAWAMLTLPGAAAAWCRLIDSDQGASGLARP